MLDETGQHLAGGPSAAGERVQQGPVHPALRRLPHRQPQDRGRRRLWRLAVAPRPGFGLDEPPTQRGYQHGVGGVQADVHGPDLDRRVRRREAGVEVDHPVVENDLGGDHLLHKPVVPLRGPERLGRPGGRPPQPGLVAEAGIAAVPPAPEGRVGAERQQRRQPRPDPVQHGDSLVVSIDRDVDVAPAGQLVLCGDAELLDHALGTLVRCGRWGRGSRRGPRGDDPDTLLLRGRRCGAAPGPEVVLQVLQPGPRRVSTSSCCCCSS